jgi:hypothetical protein
MLSQPAKGLAVAICLACSSCVRVQWNRAMFCRGIDSNELTVLRAGESQLNDCLELFGSPLYVWQAGADQYAVAYGWDMDKGWGINVSIPVTQEFSASFDYDDLDRRLYGIVMTFDANDQLQYQRQGFLSEIAEGYLRRPSSFPGSGDEVGSEESSNQGAEEQSH